MDQGRELAGISQMIWWEREIPIIRIKRGRSGNGDSPVSRSGAGSPGVEGFAAP